MKPRVLLVGKIGSIVHWLEDARDGFEDASAAPQIFALNGNTPLAAARRRLAKMRGRVALEQHLARQLEATLTAYKPQIVLFVQAYWAPAALLDVVKSRGVPAAGWVGDRFGPSERELAQRLDRVYYTDSGFLAKAQEFGFPGNGCYLPHAANTRLFHPSGAQRTNRVLFVAVPTQHRLELLKHVKTPIAVYGRGWNAVRHSPHEVHNHWVARKRLPRLYQESLAVLNVHNELNVIEGLNQRSFEPAACGTAVIHDALADISQCFEPEKEILVFRDAMELEAVCERVRKDKLLAHRIGMGALARVRAHHTCAHRTKTMLQDFGLSA